MPEKRKAILVAAGYDPSARAGLLADAQMLTRLEVPFCGLITAHTVQTDKAVLDMTPVSWPEVKRQLEALNELYAFPAVKIGLMPSLRLLNHLLDWVLEKNKEAKVVWDPVLGSSSGFLFLDLEKEKELLPEVLEKVYLLTPNQPEAEAFQSFLPRFNHLVYTLIKGGHAVGDVAEDCLQFSGEVLARWTHPRLPKGARGTGCRMASAIAAGLFKGYDIIEACDLGVREVQHYLKRENEVAYA